MAKGAGAAPKYAWAGELHALGCSAAVTASLPSPLGNSVSEIGTLGTRLGARPGTLPHCSIRNRIALEGSRLGEFCLQLIDGTTDYSPTALQQLGHGASPTPPGPLLDRIHPDDLAAVVGAIESHVERSAELDIECRIATAANYRWFRFTARAWFEDNAPTHLIGCLDDVSERRRLEDALARAEQRYRDLDREHLEIQDALVVLTRRAEAADAARSVLHDIGNVTNGLLLSTETLREILRSGSTERIRRLARRLQDPGGELSRFLRTDSMGAQLVAYVQTVDESIRGELDEMTEAVDRVLRAVRDIRVIVESERRSVVPVVVTEPQPLRELVGDAVALAQTRESMQPVRVHVDIAPDAEDEILTDRAIFLRILINLLRNALDAASHGPDPTRACVRIRVVRIDERLQITVTDNGPGVPDELREQLFGVGYSTKGELRKGDGLRSSARFAKELGGSLSLATSSPQGASFVFILRDAWVAKQVFHDATGSA